MRSSTAHETRYAKSAPPRRFYSVPIAERDQRPDRLGDLVGCMADLLVEVHRQSEELAQYRGDDARVRGAIARLAQLDRSLGEVGVEAASVHRLLAHEHLT